MITFGGFGLCTSLLELSLLVVNSRSIIGPKHLIFLVILCCAYFVVAAQIGGPVDIVFLNMRVLEHVLILRDILVHDV